MSAPGMPAWIDTGKAVVNWLTSRPEVDPARIGLAGNSFGSFFGTIAAAHEPRIRAVAVSAVCHEPGFHTIFEEASPTGRVPARDHIDIIQHAPDHLKRNHRLDEVGLRPEASINMMPMTPSSKPNMSHVSTRSRKASELACSSGKVLMSAPALANGRLEIPVPVDFGDLHRLTGATSG